MQNELKQRREHQDEKKLRPAVDPVCGMEVSRRDAPQETCGPDRFFFCSEVCRERFRANPTRYTVSCVETK